MFSTLAPRPSRPIGQPSCASSLCPRPLRSCGTRYGMAFLKHSRCNATGDPMASSGRQDSPKSDASNLKGVHVLVVEDTWHVAKALKSALEQLGMHVSGPAATTAEAKRLVAAHMPAVAVVDVNLKREMACGLIDDLHGQ